jgi:hypothetical protein
LFHRASVARAMIERMMMAQQIQNRTRWIFFMANFCDKQLSAQYAVFVDRGRSWNCIWCSRLPGCGPGWPPARLADSRRPGRSFSDAPPGSPPDRRGPAHSPRGRCGSSSLRLHPLHISPVQFLHPGIEEVLPFFC